MKDAEAQLASLNETLGGGPDLPALASDTVKEEFGVVDATEFLVKQGVRELEAANPDSQKWQMWAPSVLASHGAKVVIDLDIDSDGDYPPTTAVVPLPI